MTEKLPYESEGEEREDLIVDLRSPAPDLEQVLREDDEFRRAAERDEFVGKVFNKVLLVGVAAREANPGTVILRNDRQLTDGRWLQKESIEIMQSAAQAGLDRLRGNEFIDSVDHAVYERLFERTEDKTHEEFIERLAWISQNKWHLLTNNDFEMSREEKDKFKDIESSLAIASNLLFREMFYGITVNESSRTDAAILLDNIIDPAIGVEFLNPSYWHNSLLYADRRRRTLHRDYLYYAWLIEQGSLLARVLRSGQLAVQSSIDV